MGRVRPRPHHDEIVPRDLRAIDPVSGRDELLFRFRIVHQQQIGIVVRSGPKRLTRPLRENMHGYSGLFGEDRQNVRQQSRIFDRRSRGENDRLRRALGGNSRSPEERNEQDDDQLPQFHHYSPSRKAVLLTATLIPIRTKPSPRASSKSPLLVSNTIAVVIIRV